MAAPSGEIKPEAWTLTAAATRDNAARSERKDTMASAQTLARHVPLRDN